MTMTLKLYAQLGKYLPEGTPANEAEIDLADGTSVTDVLDKYQVPPEMCHLVLVNGNYLAPEARGSHLLEDKDHLAVWPPVAGG
ncbi:MoaD/ThiS family protein [Terasakiella sp. A23]|uniref:MoaD/ThiS family protein n=1 Tax=Terasakiella sp. FCG-A23 TaxID=3080561 RepID=UPI002955A5D3|nr:MoaD/ThiS family protein [Terasakiella sp. A23]MDV7340882.1 MoaD/ThiS family protein [Terasakiella sp. A23]